MPTEQTSADRQYPVAFKAPQQARVYNTAGKRQLHTEVRDWLTIEEFESIMPGYKITSYMELQAVGPNSWTVYITAAEVLNCERDQAVQGKFINHIRQRHLKQRPLTAEELRAMARDYDDIEPQPLLFLLELESMALSQAPRTLTTATGWKTA